VARDRVAERYVQRLGRPADLSRYVRETTLKVLRIADVAAPGATVALPGDAREAWRMLEGLRYLVSERKPIAWTQVYLRGVYGAVATDRDRDDVPLYALVERRYGVKALTVQQEIAGVAIEPGVATLLRVPARSVGLSVRREYVSTTGEVFEVAISVHPADRYRYRTQLALDAPSISARRRGSGCAR
jgi:DNA-binding GntR family transcriptional regulator